MVRSFFVGPRLTQEHADKVSKKFGGPPIKAGFLKSGSFIMFMHSQYLLRAPAHLPGANKGQEIRHAGMAKEWWAQSSAGDSTKPSSMLSHFLACSGQRSLATSLLPTP